MTYTDVAQKYGRPNYALYPSLGYSYSTLAKILADREKQQGNDLEEAVAFIAVEKAIREADAQESTLDNGYILYAIIKGKKPIHIGVYAGRNISVERKRNPIRDARKRYGDGCVFVILQTELSQRKALSLQQTLKRRLLQ